MQINWRNVLPKFIEFCMELPFCCPSQGHQYGPVWQLEANTTICHWVLLWKHEFITPIYHPNEASTSPPRDQNPPVHLKFWNWKFEQKLYYLLTTNVALLNTLGAESADRGKLVYSFPDSSCWPRWWFILPLAGSKIGHKKLRLGWKFPIPCP